MIYQPFVSRARARVIRVDDDDDDRRVVGMMWAARVLGFRGVEWDLLVDVLRTTMTTWIRFGSRLTKRLHRQSPGCTVACHRRSLERPSSFLDEEDANAPGP